MVLNEAAQRLGVSLNILGDSKFFLIDSELFNKDNEAQAEQNALAA